MGKYELTHKQFNKIYDKHGNLIEFTDERGNIWWDDFIFGWVSNVPDRIDKQYRLR